MGQVLGPDKIGTLSQASNTITLGPSRLTIGGQQYVTSSLNVAANISVAVERYQIYAVVNAGSVILVVSSNENSVGPAGYNSWKLVGSYMTNGASPVAFGSFLNIVGAPHSTDMNFNVAATNFGSITNQGSFFYRKGPKMYMETRFLTGTHSPALAQVSIPGLKTISAPLPQQVIGFCISQSGTIYSNPVLSTGGSSSHVIFGNGESAGSQLSGTNATNWNNATIISFFAEFEVTGWSNLSIEDL